MPNPRTFFETDPWDTDDEEPTYSDTSDDEDSKEEKKEEGELQEEKSSPHTPEPYVPQSPSPEFSPHTPELPSGLSFMEGHTPPGYFPPFSPDDDEGEMPPEDYLWDGFVPGRPGHRRVWDGYETVSPPPDQFIVRHDDDTPTQEDLVDFLRQLAYEDDDPEAIELLRRWDRGRPPSPLSPTYRPWLAPGSHVWDGRALWNFDTTDMRTPRPRRWERPTRRETELTPNIFDGGSFRERGPSSPPPLHREPPAEQWLNDRRSPGGTLHI